MSIWDENGNREGGRREGQAARRAFRPINKKKEAAEATSLQKH